MKMLGGVSSLFASSQNEIFFCIFFFVFFLRSGVRHLGPIPCLNFRKYFSVICFCMIKKMQILDLGSNHYMSKMSQKLPTVQKYCQATQYSFCIFFLVFSFIFLDIYFFVFYIVLCMILWRSNLWFKALSFVLQCSPLVTFS